jgi:hypothetical protein
MDTLFRGLHLPCTRLARTRRTKRGLKSPLRFVPTIEISIFKPERRIHTVSKDLVIGRDETIFPIFYDVFKEFIGDARVRGINEVIDVRVFVTEPVFGGIEEIVNGETVSIHETNEIVGIERSAIEESGGE